MRIGIIAYGFERAAPPSSVSYTLELARALRDAGADVILLTTGRGAEHRVPEGFPTYRLTGGRLLPGLMTAGNLGLLVAARTLHLDIVHDPTGVAPFLLRALFGGAQAVVTIHDLVSYVFPETHTSLTNLVQKVWLPLGLRFANHVVTVSEHSKGDLRQFLDLDSSRVTVVPCGVGPAFTPESTPGEAERLTARYGIRFPYLLYLGDVQARKNIDGLLRAFALLRRQLREHQLVVAGAATWKYEAIYRTLVTLGLQDDVLFTGYVGAGDVPALYRQASVFAFPSLYEGFGRPPLEAMACGTPVVTSNISSLPEVTGDAALTVDPRDPTALAGAIARILDDPGLADELRARGLVRAKQYTWERAARETLALYERMLASTTAAVAETRS